MQNPTVNSDDSAIRRQFRFGVLFKGILIVCVPLIFQFVLFAALTSQIRQIEIEMARETRARRILQKMNKMTEMTYEFGSLAAQIKNGANLSDEKLRDTMQIALDQIDEYRNEIKQLIKGHKDEEDGFSGIDKFHDQYAHTARGVLDALAGKRPMTDIVEQFGGYTSLRHGMLPQLISSLKQFNAKYQKIEKNSPEAQKRLRDAQKGVMLCGLAGNVAIAFLLVLYFSRSITDRLKIMTLNTSLLARRQPLLPRISGSDEIAQLDGVFHSMADALEEAAREKQEFMDLVAHDIRSPLTAILGNIILLNLGKLGELPEEARQRMITTEQNSRKLITVINDLLEFEKIESGQLEMKKAHTLVEPVLDSVFQKLESSVDKVGVELEMNVPDEAVSVFADPELLVQVIEKLLNNFVDFAKAGEKIIVSARSNDAAEVEFTIFNRARQSPCELFANVFNRYGGAQSKEIRQHFGKGLSLPLCKMIIESEGGQIGVRSADEGMTFWFTLAQGTTVNDTVEIVSPSSPS